MTKLKTSVAVLLCTGFALPAIAGFTGPSNVRIVTVAEAKEMSDDTNVILQGYIQSSLGDEKYIFKDDSSTIKIEIDDEDWNGLNVGPEDKIEIQGEVDTHLMKPTEIDVDIVKLAQ